MRKPALALQLDAHRPPGSGTFVRSPLRRVVRRPDPILSRISEEIDPCAAGIVALAEALVTTMQASPACVSLSAPQLGESVRMFAIDVSGHRKACTCAGLVVLVNPKIVERSADIVMREGCMSVPDFTGNVARAAEVVVEGFEPGTSRLVRLTANAIEARCIQHEIDHLDGYVFVDRVEDPQKSLFPRKTYV